MAPITVENPLPEIGSPPYRAPSVGHIVGHLRNIKVTLYIFQLVRISIWFQLGEPEFHSLRWSEIYTKSWGVFP